MLKRPDHVPDRHARHRARQRAGKAVAPVEYDAAVVDFLVKNLWLEERETCDRSAIGAGIARMLADAARR
jgi:hypothetical protein